MSEDQNSQWMNRLLTWKNKAELDVRRMTAKVKSERKKFELANQGNDAEYTTALNSLHDAERSLAIAMDLRAIKRVIACMIQIIILAFIGWKILIYIPNVSELKNTKIMGVTVPLNGSEAAVDKDCLAALKVFRTQTSVTSLEPCLANSKLADVRVDINYKTSKKEKEDKKP